MGKSQEETRIATGIRQVIKNAKSNQASYLEKERGQQTEGEDSER
jgi:hypothetical protein